MLALQVIAVAYLIGSIPFSFLVARAFGVHDVRRVGSGNVGATNVLRNAGKMAGALALLLDLGKGAAASALAGRLAPGEAALPALRSTFVAPTLPLPTSRTSWTPNARATRKLNGIEPIR